MTIAITGVTGTIGQGFLPFLEADARVERVIGIASRPWSPEAAGFAKVDYRRVDVRDRHRLEAALDGADIVVHLAFSLYGVRQSRTMLDQINVDGCRNTFRAASAVGARRFVYTSSAAVYGFSGERPTRVDEDAPVDENQRHFYARQKVAVERALLDEIARNPDMECILFRPCAVVGPHALGAAAHAIPKSVVNAAGVAVTIAASAGLRPPMPGPPVPLQFVHGRDVGQALHLAATGDVTSGVYNLAGEGVVEAREVPRLVGLRTLPMPKAVSRAALGAAARLPHVVPAVGWLQLLTQPLELDTTRARRELRWSPEFSSRDALAATRRAFAI